MPLVWKGDAVKAHVREAARGAIDETNAEAAREAAAAWPVATGLSAENIDVLEPAETSGTITAGAFGGAVLPAGDYTPSSRLRILFTEIGFRGKPGLGILRRAADQANQGLANRIRERMP